MAQALPAPAQIGPDARRRGPELREACIARAAAGRTDDAVADAQALRQLYADMTLFFEKDYPAADAVTFSRDGERLAAAIPTALEQGDVTAAKGAARAIALACNDCHDPYKPLP
jgi:hypothetical protein